MSRTHQLTIMLLLSAFGLISNASYIHAKAFVAQLMLESAWASSLEGKENPKPWPWADTWPVARLAAPDLGISQIVLAGASGSSLAFGPGHLYGSSTPGEKGNVIISGHRDTHFSFLKDLAKGDFLVLETNKKHIAYRVTAMQIVDSNQHANIPTDQFDKLVLLTCYPFNAIQAGGPLRYMVTAEPIGIENNKSTPSDLW